MLTVKKPIKIMMNKYRLLFKKIDDDVITLQGTSCTKKNVASINVKLKLKIDLFLVFFQNSLFMIYRIVALLLPLNEDQSIPI
jgi:hypothetical protein